MPCRILLQVTEFGVSGQVEALALDIDSLFIKVTICCVTGGKMPSFPFSQYLLLRPCLSLFKMLLTTRLLSRGIELHFTLHGRHIFISFKVMFAECHANNLASLSALSASTINRGGKKAEE